MPRRLQHAQLAAKGGGWPNGDYGLRRLQRLITRLADRVLSALATEPRSVLAVAAEVGISWPTVMRLVAATVTVVHDPVAVPPYPADRDRQERGVNTPTTLKVEATIVQPSYS